MSFTFGVQIGYTLDGTSFGLQTQVLGDRPIKRSKSNVAAALAAVLQTRTDADTGVLRFTSDPGLAVGNRVDVYWEGGHRRGMLVSAIAGVGPFDVTVGTAGGDVGAGDDFPIATTALTIGKPIGYDFEFDGDLLKALVASAEAKAIVVVTDASDVELWSAVFPTINGVSAWWEGIGSVNPLAGDAVAKVYFSHGDSASTRKVQIGALTS